MKRKKLKTTKKNNQQIVYYPDDMLWLEAIVHELAEKEGRRPPELFREAFCEYFGDRHPELKRLWGAWKTVNN